MWEAFGWVLIGPVMQSAVSHVGLLLCAVWQLSHTSFIPGDMHEELASDSRHYVFCWIPASVITFGLCIGNMQPLDPSLTYIKSHLCFFTFTANDIGQF